MIAIIAFKMMIVGLIGLSLHRIIEEVDKAELNLLLQKISFQEYQEVKNQSLYKALFLALISMVLIL